MLKSGTALSRHQRFATARSHLTTTSKAGHRRCARAPRGAGEPHERPAVRRRSISRCSDAEDALWLALDIGVSRVETPSPVSFLRSVRWSLRSDQHRHPPSTAALYFALQSGVPLPRRGLGAQPPAHIVPVAGSPSSSAGRFARMTDSKTARDRHCSLTCGEGLYDVQTRRSVPIKKTPDLRSTPECPEVSPAVPTRVWVGVRDGLMSFRWNTVAGSMKAASRGRSFEIRALHLREPDGSLWAGTETQGVLRVTFPHATDG